MTSEDPRRKLIAEAMAMRTEFHHRDALRIASTAALPAAVELIEELTAKVEDLRAGQANDDRDHRASVATIAEQAKEIERLRSFVGRCAEGEHPDEIPEEALALALPDKLERLRRDEADRRMAGDPLIAHLMPEKGDA